METVERKLTSDDGLDIHYWLTWEKGMSDVFKVFHNGASMNHTSFRGLEKRLNDLGFPTIT